MKLPPNLTWKPYIQNYQAVIKDFVKMYEGYNKEYVDGFMAESN